MKILKSIKGRLNGIKNTLKSRYWKYVTYYNDGEIWEKSILFESFGGGNFQGNPYYIFKEIFHDPSYNEYTLYVAHKNPPLLVEDLEKRGLTDARVVVVEKDSPRYKNVLSHAKYLVNNVSFTMDFIKKDGQVYVNTWHGTPLKTLGRSILNDPFECLNGQRNFLMCDYLLAPNPLTRKVFEEEYMTHGIMPGKIIDCGYPRNTVFFDEKYRQEIRARYGLDKVISVFYMPTWRGTACGINKVDQISEMERLAKELGDSYRVYLKLHPAMVNTDTEFQYCHKTPEHVEVYEFLNAVDILITDYSSVFFDFANTDKKIVLYQYDRDEYFKGRGVYKTVEENLPFPIAYSYDELKATVQNVDVSGLDYSGFKSGFCPYDGIGETKKLLQILASEREKNGDNAVDFYIIDFLTTDEEILRIKEQLSGKTYRFVFLLDRKTRGNRQLTCWKELDYTALYTFNRLRFFERIGYAWNKMLYACFRCKRALKKCQALAKRERKRLFGNVNVGRIYAKGKRLPVAVKMDAEPFPKDLL